MLSKKNLKIVLSFLIVTLLFYFLFRNIDTELFLKYLSLGSKPMIAAGVAVYLLAFFVSEARFVLATEDESNPGSQTAKDEISCVNDHPLFLYGRCVERYRFVALCVHCLDL